MRRVDPLIPLDNVAVTYPFAMENNPRRAVSILAPAELNKRPPLFGVVIDRRQNMNRLVDGADLGDGLCQLGRAVGNLESKHFLGSPGALDEIALFLNQSDFESVQNVGKARRADQINAPFRLQLDNRAVINSHIGLIVEP
jgi:hypothetical protein